MPIKVCLGGATGWVGSTLSRSIHMSTDFQLISALGEKSAGKSLGELLQIPDLKIMISNSLERAFSAGPDVYIDYTHPRAVKNNVVTAIQYEIPVVIGASGLTEEDLDNIHDLALSKKVGVLAAGNFAITAVLLQKFSTIAAKYIHQWEILDYSNVEKPDAPSGTARELAARLAKIRRPKLHYPIKDTYGLKESRGGCVKGTQVHSIRLPSYNFSVEIIFGQDNERLVMHHDAGSGAEPYVAGTLLAARAVQSFSGLKRGLDTVMDL